MNIPVRNLYFMLLYAWDYLEASDIADVGSMDGDHPVDLLAFVLAKGVDRALRRGVDHEYVVYETVTSRLRGRIRFGQSVTTGAVARRTMVCSADELTSDVLRNRLVRSTLRRLADSEIVERDLRKELHRLYRRMGAVTEVRITDQLFGRVLIQRNSRSYRLLLALCRLVHEGLVVDESGEGRRFLDFERDKGRMRAVFESFVRNLLRRRLAHKYDVNGRRADWQGVTGARESVALIPSLNMDVVVEGTERVLVIDTKYTPSALSWRFDTPRFRAPHLFQLFAYLENYALLYPKHNIGGMLLYPATNLRLDQSFTLSGHPVRVVTLDLAKEWYLIEEDLLRFAEEGMGETSEVTL